MNIGIVTQSLKGNYGGILQNFALQQVLLSLGHKVITFDYMQKPRFVDYLRCRVKRILRLADSRLEYYPKRNHPQICDFIDRNIFKTHMFWNRYRSSLISWYDIQALVVGSDQVWRPCYNHYLEDSFLQFARGYKMPKIAYAASFGTSEWEYTTKQARVCSKLLANFTAVSVRESSAINLASKLGAKAEQVLDPTLLLGKDGFDKILNSATKTNDNDPYIGTYVLDKSEKKFDLITQLQSELGINLLLSSTQNEAGMGPIEWIQRIKDSRFFITDSFHGTVFCILYHVPFVALCNSERGADRFSSLLNTLNLSNRLISDSNITEALNIVSEPIDWDFVDAKLDDLRVKSREFLQRNLN